MFFLNLSYSDPRLYIEPFVTNFHFICVGLHKQHHASQRRRVVHGQTKLLLGQALPSPVAALPPEALPKEISSSEQE